MQVRFLPSSLFGRVALVLIVGLTIMQIGSTLLSIRERNRFAHAYEQVHWLSHVTHAVKTLEQQPPEERNFLFQALRTTYLSYRLADPELPAPVIEDDEILEALAPLSGIGHEVRQIHTDREDLKKLVVRLTDGTWIRITYCAPPPFGWNSNFLFKLGFLLITGLGITFLAAHLAIRPLARFKEAAERLSDDIDAPPLPETGMEETREVAHALNCMQESVKECISKRTALLSSISHDLKTPLARLKLRTEFIRDDQELRASLLHELDTMETMMEATFDLLRNGSGEEPRMIDINALVDSLAADSAEFSDMDIAVRGRAAEPYWARSVTLRRALVNLIENARKYAGNSVEIELEDTSEMLAIRIMDRGPGIPEREHVRILDPFQRLEPSRNPATGGLGLGLAIARNAVELHGGSLHLHNRAQGGLEVAMLFPRAGHGPAVQAAE